MPINNQLSNSASPVDLLEKKAGDSAVGYVREGRA